MNTCRDPLSKASFRPPAVRRWRTLGSAACALLGAVASGRAQGFATAPRGPANPERIVITADGLPSAYGAPQAFSRTRSSAIGR